MATAQAQEIVVNDAWIRGVPPAAKTTAAFMTIQNAGSEERILLAATCEVAESAQIHTMEQVGEVMKMRELSSLRVPSSGQTRLAPKGNHIMLIGLFRPISEGEVIPISLNFSDGSIVNVDAVVRKWRPMSPMSHQ